MKRTRWPALVVLGTVVLSAQVQPQRPGAAQRLVGAWQLVTRTVQANGKTLADPVLGTPALAAAPRFVIPGHDPAVFDRFPKPGNGVARID